MHFIKGQIINFEIKWLQKLTCDNLEGLTECDNVSQWKDLLSDNSVTYWVLSSCKDSVCQLSYYFSSLNSDLCVSLLTRRSQSDTAPECSSMHSIPTTLTFLAVHIQAPCCQSSGIWDELHQIFTQLMLGVAHNKLFIQTREECNSLDWRYNEENGDKYPPYFDGGCSDKFPGFFHI